MLVGAGIEAVPGIEKARELGCRVVVSDLDPMAPGVVLADDFLEASTYDVAATVAAARCYHKQQPIDGVLAIATDVPRTVAVVADALSIPGISYHAATLAADKLAMKQAFCKAGVETPWFTAVTDVQELGALIASEGLPLVIKPVDSRGARGVLCLMADVDQAWAFAQAQAHSPTGRVMVERFLDGPQVSTESLVIDGVAHTPGFSDRNYEYLERFAPHIIENGGELPSHLDEITRRRVQRLVNDAARAMGIKNGVVKGDIVIHAGQPHVIEMAARLSGGFFCSHEIPLNTGVDFVGLTIRQALGERIDPAALRPRYQHPVAQRYLFPAPGKVRSVAVAEWVQTDPDIRLFQLRLQPGDVVSPIHAHPARGGVVIATGETRQAAIDRAEAAIAAISVEVE